MTAFYLSLAYLACVFFVLRFFNVAGDDHDDED